MIIEVNSKAVGRVPERYGADIERPSRGLLLEYNMYGMDLWLRYRKELPSYILDANARGCKADRASFSHADIVQSTVLEGHQYCVIKSGLPAMASHVCP